MVGLGSHAHLPVLFCLAKQKAPNSLSAHKVRTVLWLHPLPAINKVYGLRTKLGAGGEEQLEQLGRAVTSLSLSTTTTCLGRTAPHAQSGMGMPGTWEQTGEETVRLVLFHQVGR